MKLRKGQLLGDINACYNKLLFLKKNLVTDYRMEISFG